MKKIFSLRYVQLFISLIGQSLGLLEPLRIQLIENAAQVRRIFYTATSA